MVIYSTTPKSTPNFLYTIYMLNVICLSFASFNFHHKVKDNETVLTLKQKIFSNYAIEIIDQKLYYDDLELDDDYLLNELLCLGENITLDLRVRNLLLEPLIPISRINNGIQKVDYMVACDETLRAPSAASLSPLFDPSSMPSVASLSPPPFNLNSDLEDTSYPFFDPGSMPSVAPLSPPPFNLNFDLEDTSCPLFDPSSMPSVASLSPPLFDPSSMPSLQSKAISTSSTMTTTTTTTATSSHPPVRTNTALSPSNSLRDDLQGCCPPTPVIKPADFFYFDSCTTQGTALTNRYNLPFWSQKTTPDKIAETSTDSHPNEADTASCSTLAVDTTKKCTT